MSQLVQKINSVHDNLVSELMNREKMERLRIASNTVEELEWRKAEKK